MKTESNKSDRSSNIEILRIFLMVSILIFHIYWQNGGFFSEFSTNSWFVFLIGQWGVAAVYSFISITSFFLINNRNKSIVRKILKLYSEIIFIYIIKITAISFISENGFALEPFLKSPWKALFNSWFILPYILLVLIYPLINSLILFLDKNNYLKLLIFFSLMFLFLGYKDSFSLLSDTYAFVFVYLIVGFFSKYNIFNEFKKLKRKLIRIIWSIVFITTAVNTVLLYISQYYCNDQLTFLIKMNISRYSAIMLFFGILIFYYFYYFIEIKRSSLVNKISKSTFDIFLFHESTIITTFFLNIYGVDSLISMGTFKTLEIIVSYVVVIFFTGALLNFLYSIFSKLVFVRIINLLINSKLINKIDTWLLGGQTNFSNIKI